MVFVIVSFCEEIRLCYINVKIIIKELWPVKLN